LGYYNSKLILENKVRIGWSEKICKLSWGERDDVNTTTTTGSTVYEQWVYSMGNYLYFENGILVAIQD